MGNSGLIRAAKHTLVDTRRLTRVDQQMQTFGANLLDQRYEQRNPFRDRTLTGRSGMVAPQITLLSVDAKRAVNVPLLFCSISSVIPVRVVSCALELHGPRPPPSSRSKFMLMAKLLGTPIETHWLAAIPSCFLVEICCVLPNYPHPFRNQERFSRFFSVL
jgi:hypothetical protein